jgi:uncharacterized membrane protein
LYLFWLPSDFISNNTMSTIHIWLFIAQAISIVSISIISFGVIKTIISYCHTEYKIIRKHKKFKSFHTIRHDLAAYLLLALELAVAVDIIESIIHPNYENLIKLWALVILRFLIWYLLNREMRDLQQQNHSKDKHEKEE